jgi:hypothetical protein
MKKKQLSFEARYPTKRAREIADAVFDKLPLETQLGECCRAWEWAYLNANGIVKGTETS